MEKRNNIKTRNTAKARRAYKQMNSGFTTMEYSINALPKCPYCSGKMKIQTEMIEEKGLTNVLVCSNNDAMHSVKCEIKKLQGNTIRLLSTPADKRLRHLRQETHWYMNQLISNNIFKSTSDVYAYMNDRLTLGSGINEISNWQLSNGESNIASLGQGRVKHVGELKEFGCQEIIKESITLLYKNKNRLKEVRAHGNPHYEPQELTEMLSEIAINRKEEREKYEKATA